MSLLRRVRFALIHVVGAVPVLVGAVSIASAQQPPAPAPAAGGGQGGGRQGGRGGGVEIHPGEECPAGMTEVRPERCVAPEFPVPSIVDYRPKSTLVSPQHLVPKAKFPAIDFHGHPGQLLSSADGVKSLVTALDTLNVRLMVSADNISGDRLTRTLSVIQDSPYKDRVRVLAGVNFSNVGPGWADRAIQQLEADLRPARWGLARSAKASACARARPMGPCSSSTIRISIRSGTPARV